MATGEERVIIEQVPEQPQAVMGPGGVPQGATTDQYYKTQPIPNRFNNPEWFKGYSTKKEHAMYRTSAADYGSRVPTVHTMPISFHARSQKFSEHLGKCGMYRNQSLNTAMDQSRV